MKSKPRVLVFASGSASGGGSGFRELVEFSRTDPPVLDAEIVGVVSNHRRGGVWKYATELGHGWEFLYWNGPFSATGYRGIVHDVRADYVMLSGWLKLAKGLDPARTVNIHPGPLPLTEGLYGHLVHEKVWDEFHAGRITQTAVTMHFVSEEYDRGPVFFRMPVALRKGDTPEDIAARVNEKERAWQAHMLNLVVHGYISLHDGRVCYRDHAPKRLFF